jgi:predicted TIM-barrel enzyme
VSPLASKQIGEYMKLEQIEEKRKQIIEAFKNAVVSSTLKKVDETTPEAIENARVSALVEQLNRTSSDN